MDPWDTDAWMGLVKEAQGNGGGGMSLKDVLRYIGMFSRYYCCTGGFLMVLY